jgi:hypothetical protein
MEEDKKHVIPSMEINAKNQIVEQTKDIPLTITRDGVPTEELITVRKLNTGVRNKIKAECTKTTILGGQPQIKIDESEIQEKILSHAIIKAPFETEVNDIKKLPSDVTDYLFDEYNEFAEPSEKKNLKSEKV